MTAKVVIYTKDYCPYCKNAKDLLNNKNIKFEEIDTSNNEELRQELVNLSGGRKTVPQIFIDDKCFGGFDDINELNKQGKLDALLGVV